MQKDKKCCTTNASTVLLVSFFLLLVITPTLISARYLPTRSDNSRRERIKEVLRLVSNSFYPLSTARNECAKCCFFFIRVAWKLPIVFLQWQLAKVSSRLLAWPQLPLADNWRVASDQTCHFSLTFSSNRVIMCMTAFWVRSSSLLANFRLFLSTAARIVQRQRPSIGQPQLRWCKRISPFLFARRFRSFRATRLWIRRRNESIPSFIFFRPE